MTTSATYTPFLSLPAELPSLTFTPAMLQGGRFSTSSVVDERVVLGEDYLVGKFAELKSEIGIELFSQLTIADKLFMLETAGSIDFGKAIDLDGVATTITDYGEEQTGQG
jgi:hypothetical protein